jgi:beta-hydroxylase
MLNYAFVGIIAVYAASFTYLYRRCRDHLPLKKYLSNHVLMFAPLNFLFTFFMAGGPKPTFAASAVPGLDRLKANYPAIRAEAKALLDNGIFQRPPAADEPGYNTFEQGGWRLYPIKWYSDECRSSAVSACPETCAIVNSIPAVRSAMFTVLPPGARLGRHHDPVASSLRYHLGLVTPNSNQCALTLDGVDYPWGDGEELLFDQTYLHSAVNRTATPRVILFCDVEKTQLRGVIKRLADAVDYGLVAKMTGANDGGQLSWLSWAYKPIYRLRALVKKEIKPRSLLAYNVIKFGAIALVLLALYSLAHLASQIV